MQHNLPVNDKIKQFLDGVDGLSVEVLAELSKLRSHNAEQSDEKNLLPLPENIIELFSLCGELIELIQEKTPQDEQRSNITHTKLTQLLEESGIATNAVNLGKLYFLIKKCLPTDMANDAKFLADSIFALRVSVLKPTNENIEHELGTSIAKISFDLEEEVNAILTLRRGASQSSMSAIAPSLVVRPTGPNPSIKEPHEQSIAPDLNLEAMPSQAEPVKPYDPLLNLINSIIDSDFNFTEEEYNAIIDLYDQSQPQTHVSFSQLVLDKLNRNEDIGFRTEVIPQAINFIKLIESLGLLQSHMLTIPATIGQKGMELGADDMLPVLFLWLNKYKDKHAELASKLTKLEMIIPMKGAAGYGLIQLMSAIQYISTQKTEDITPEKIGQENKLITKLEQFMQNIESLDQNSFLSNISRIEISDSDTSQKESINLSASHLFKGEPSEAEKELRKVAPIKIDKLDKADKADKSDKTDKADKLAKLQSLIKTAENEYNTTLKRRTHKKDFAKLTAEIDKIMNDTQEDKLERALKAVENAYAKEQNGSRILNFFSSRKKAASGHVFAKKINAHSATHHYPRMLALILEHPELKHEPTASKNNSTRKVMPTREASYETIAPSGDHHRDIVTLNNAITEIGVKNLTSNQQFIARDVDNIIKYGNNATLLPNWRINLIATAISENTGITPNIAREAIKLMVSKLKDNKDVDYDSLKSSLDNLISFENIERGIGEIADASDRNQIKTFIEKLSNIEVHLKTITDKEKALSQRNENDMENKPRLAQ